MHHISQGIVPCLWFDKEAEAAAELYSSVFLKHRIIGTSHFPTTGENPPQAVPGSVLTIEMEIADYAISLLNGGPYFKVNPSISFFVQVNTEAEAHRIYNLLAKGGKELMAMDSYPWSPRYGWVADRFGISWQVMCITSGPVAPEIFPCLMYTDKQRGRAEEAINFYTQVFPDSNIVNLEKYSGKEGPVGKIKHGRFVIANQTFVAMDSHIENGFTFNEGISFQVQCKDQKEIDRYWEVLAQGGEYSQCGWLEDKFGVSWQVVPDNTIDWLTSKDTAAKDRAFKAMMNMTKLDIAVLEKAFKG